MIKAVIFDLDGTIAYTIEDLKTGMNLMLSEMGYPTRSTEQILEAINCGALEFVRKSLPSDVGSDEEKLQKCYECYNGHYKEHYLDKTKVYDGLFDVVMELKDKGLKLGVLSNKGDEHTNGIVNKLFPKETFDHVQGYMPIYPTKPDPTSALAIAKMFGAEPSEVLYIGDSNVDMETANNAGFFACGCTWGYRSRDVLISSGAEVLVDKPEEILGLL